MQISPAYIRNLRRIESWIYTHCFKFNSKSNADVHKKLRNLRHERQSKE